MIEIIVLDVDGCLTDGKITYDANGIESKSFSVKDGLAITSWHKLGKRSAIITGRTSSIVEKRAQELGITHLYQGIHNKDEILAKILKEEHLTLKNVAAIGDDLNDFKMLKAAEHSFTPSNGSHYIQTIVTTVLNKNGGDGAVREMIEIIIKNENLESEFINVWQ